jgi:GNAT superfamily N-acetyltransferase
MTIRPATPADLERIVRIRNANWSDYPMTVSELERLDAVYAKRERFVLEVDGEVVAHALLEPGDGESMLSVELDVLPERQARGLGAAFWVWLEARVARFSKLRVAVPESHERPLEWHTGMTGVPRAHRGRGLAVALKWRVIALARERGILELHTNNDSLNAAMLEVNRQLGYRRVSGVVQLERHG